MALLVRGIRTLNRRLRSLSSNSYEMTTYEEMGISSESGYATRFIQHLVRCEKHTGIIYKCLDIISYHTVFNSCSHDTKLKVLSTVFDQIRNYPQADPVEVTHISFPIQLLGFIQCQIAQTHIQTILRLSAQIRYLEDNSR